MRSEIRTAARIRDRLLDHAAEAITDDMLPVLEDWVARHPEYDALTADVHGESWTRREEAVIKAFCDAATFEHVGLEPHLLDLFLDEHRNTLSATQRRLLADWSRGTVPGYLEIVAHRGSSMVARHLADGLEYTVDDDGTGRFVGTSRVGDVVRARLLPVGGRWLGCGPYVIAPAELYDRAVFRTLVSTVCDPEPSMRNPRHRERARALLAEHHARFLELFGTDVVEGDVADVMAALRRYVDMLRADGPSDWCFGELDRDLVELGLAPAFAEPVDAVDTREDAAHDYEPGGLDLALVHHPVKGARLVEGYGVLRRLHASRAPVLPHEASTFLALLDDPQVPSSVLSTLAEEFPHRLDALYAEALERPDFRWEDEGPALLARREPWTTPGSPGLVVLTEGAGEFLAGLAASGVPQG